LAVLLGLGGLVSYLSLRWLLTPTVLVPYPDTACITGLKYYTYCPADAHPLKCYHIPIVPDGQDARRILDYLATVQKQRILNPRSPIYGRDIQFQIEIDYLSGPLKGTHTGIRLGNVNYFFFISDGNSPLYAVLEPETVKETIFQMLPKQVSRYKMFAGKSLSNTRR
ncbi:hypothetical protein D1159_18725, partial [Pseudoflavonifractor sp. 524-17]|uniref:hypothetical protein n=1 Tax=Pseudoflavonifractor sp. 524-17 TaxID=2304577 RepID=UPI001379F87B